jgi:hypothetical protein
LFFQILSATAGQFGDACRLSDVMRSRSEQHGFAVHRQSGVPARYPCDELVRDIVDEAQVSGQPRRSFKILQEPRGLIGQRPQRRVSGVIERLQQGNTCCHSARVPARGDVEGSAAIQLSWPGAGAYCHSVTAARAVARGTRYLTVDASDDSAPILGRLGFKAVTTTTPYVWTPAASG